MFFVSYGVRNYQAKTAYLTSSAKILVLEARDILDYALVLLEPPAPDIDDFCPSATPPPAGVDGQLRVRSFSFVFLRAREECFVLGDAYDTTFFTCFRFFVFWCYLFSVFCCLFLCFLLVGSSAPRWEFDITIVK